MKFKSYPKYKNSGIQWLGGIPEGWEIKKLKFIVKQKKFSVVDGPFGSQMKIEDFVDEGVPVIEMEHIKDDIFKDTIDRFITEEKFKKLLRSCAKSGDIIFSKTGTIGLVANLPSYLKKSIITSRLAKISLNNGIISSGFAVFYLINLRHNGYWKFTSYGSTMDILTIFMISNTYFLIPSRKEQNTISNFLDKKTAQINELIEKDKKLIELLKEKRTALINHAVTKGLDPNAKLKDSGIQLIEKIPENWNTMKLKHIVSRKITDGPHETPEFIDEGVLFISAEAIKKDKIDFSKMRGYISKQVHKICCAKCKPRKDDIFLVKSGATTGNVAIVETNDEFSIWSPLALIRSNKEKILPKLLYYILLTDYFKKTIELSWSFGTQQNIGMSVIENCNIIIPSISQQNYLLNYLNKATDKIDKTIQKIEQKIELLEEYKKSLIHHIVTGKVDVRGVV